MRTLFFVLTFILIVWAIVGCTPSKTAVTANTSVTGGTVDSSGIFQTIDANGECSAVYGIGYVGGSIYIRGRIVATGTHSTGTIVGATVIKGIPLHAPVSSDANA